MNEKEILEFIKDENNKDFLEELSLRSNGIYGWSRLSSGKIVYISSPRPSAKEIGNAFKKLANSLKNQNRTSY